MKIKLSPLEFLMQIANNLTQQDFSDSFGWDIDDFLEILQLAELKVSDYTQILDFGCGVRRLLYAMNESLSVDRFLYG